MPDLDLITTLTQFGVAGLIAWMWLSERRAAAERERQLAEAHQRILEQRTQLQALIDVVRDNTRAITALETGQRAGVALIERLLAHRARPSAEDDTAPAPVRRAG